MNACDLCEPREHVWLSMSVRTCMCPTECCATNGCCWSMCSLGAGGWGVYGFYLALLGGFWGDANTAMAFGVCVVFLQGPALQCTPLVRMLN